jgi:hypothetical protein
MAPRRTKADHVIVFKGQELRRIRRGLGFRSAGALADRLRERPECGGLIREMVYKWEAGTARPGLAHALALEALLQVRVWDWFTWPGKKAG